MQERTQNFSSSLWQPVSYVVPKLEYKSIVLDLWVFKAQVQCCQQSGQMLLLTKDKRGDGGNGGASPSFLELEDIMGYSTSLILLSQCGVASEANVWTMLG